MLLPGEIEEVDEKVEPAVEAGVGFIRGDAPALPQRAHAAEFPVAAVDALARLDGRVAAAQGFKGRRQVLQDFTPADGAQDIRLGIGMDHGMLSGWIAKGESAGPKPALKPPS